MKIVANKKKWYVEIGMLEIFHIEQSRKLHIKDQKQKNETKLKRKNDWDVESKMKIVKDRGRKKEKVQPVEHSFPQQDHNQTQCCKIHMILNYGNHHRHQYYH